MTKLIRRIWFPTKQDILLSSRIYPSLLPIILIGNVFVSLPTITMILVIIAFTLQATVLVRGARTLPIEKDFENKYSEISGKKRKINMYISLFLPLFSTVFIPIIPNYFFIIFIVAIAIAITAMVYSGFNTALFCSVSLLYLIVTFVIFALQGNFRGFILLFIFVFLGLPYLFSFFVKINRVRLIKNAPNLALSADR